MLTFNYLNCNMGFYTLTLHKQIWIFNLYLLLKRQRLFMCKILMICLFLKIQKMFL